jgi:hypothetical protein
MTKSHATLMNPTAAAGEEAYAWKAREPSVHRDNPRVPAGLRPESAALPDGTSNGLVERADADRDAVALERRRGAQEIARRDGVARYRATLDGIFPDRGRDGSAARPASAEGSWRDPYFWLPFAEGCVMLDGVRVTTFVNDGETIYRFASEGAETPERPEARAVATEVDLARFVMDKGTDDASRPRDDVRIRRRQKRRSSASDPSAATGRAAIIERDEELLERGHSFVGAAP